MRTSLLAAAVLAAVVLPQPAHAADADVEVAHLMFMPGNVTVALGEQVTWTFPEVTTHSTTSDQGFWDSGGKSGGATFARTFTSAGSFAYHCTFHPTMRGTVRVDLAVDVPSEAKRVVRWSTAKGTGGTTFDVQTKVGSGRWTAFRTDTTRAKAAITPALGEDRPVKVRARTSRDGQDSGWSKPVRLVFA
jgi:plastocyanin